MQNNPYDFYNLAQSNNNQYQNNGQDYNFMTDPIVLAGFGVAKGQPISEAVAQAAQINQANQHAKAYAAQAQESRLNEAREALQRQLLPQILNQLDPEDLQGNIGKLQDAGLKSNEALNIASTLYEQPLKAAEKERKMNLERLGIEEGLRKEHTAASKNFKEINDSFERIKGLAKVAQKAESPAAGIGIIFSYMRMLDPTSTVREGEYATAENAAGIPERIRQQYNKALSGEPLTPIQIADFVRGSKSVYDSQKKNQNQLDKEFKRRAEKAGVDPEEVFTTYSSGNEESFEEAPLENIFDFSKSTQEELEAERDKLKKELGM